MTPPPSSGVAGLTPTGKRQYKQAFTGLGSRHGAAPLAPLSRTPSRFVLCPPVRFYIYQCRFASPHGGLSTLECRAYFIWPVYVLAMPSQRLSDKVVTRISQVTPGPFSVGITGPPAVETDHNQYRKAVAGCRIELHRIHAKRTFAVQHDHLLVRTSRLRIQPHRQADTHGAKYAEVQPMSWQIGGYGLPCIV